MTSILCQTQYMTVAEQSSLNLSIQADLTVPAFTGQSRILLFSEIDLTFAPDKKTKH